ncbi:MAG: C40 family peptidase [Paludibacteraceae bacterium]|nr:C40 family peptidase [Paludibacteraceae bacterium]
MKKTKASLFSATLLLGLFASSIQAQTKNDTIRTETVDSLATIKEEMLRDSIVEYAKKHLGKPYRGGGKGPKVFDCSGFTRFVYQQFGHALSASASGQHKEVKHLETEKIKRGDLLFFKGRNAHEKRVGHVGLVCDIDKETGSIKFIHAAFNGGVRYDFYPEGRYYKERFVCAGRVLPSSLESKIDTTLQDSTKEWIDKGSETIVVDNNEKRDTTTTPIVPIVKKDSIIIHTIEKGDNLYRLSKKYGTTVEKIKEANGLKTNNLKIGSTLKIEYKKEEK